MKFINFLKTYAGAGYYFFASMCSIASLVLFFINNELACIIALCLFCCCLFILLIGILRGINKMINDNSEENYKRIGAFLSFQSSDGVTGTYEQFRMIQSKRLFLSDIQYNFKWDGPHFPKISSRSQIITDKKHNSDKNNWDGATIRFTQPLKYNECAVINVKCDFDDYNQIPQAHVTSKVKAPIDIITFIILLTYKPQGYNSPAILKRKKINSEFDSGFETINSVPFDTNHKLYFYCLTNPDPGYYYRIEWEK